MLTSKTDKQKEKEVSGQSQHRRSAKPLQNKKFYLDLKNQVASNNLEQRLKSLGATVEWFLVKEVNYVVTDRPHWTGTGTGASGGSLSGSTPKCGAIASPSLTPAGGQYSNESPATLDSPGERGGRRRSKSRAEAMLERARLQPQQCTVDPLDNAARWSIPIWPLEKVLKWLDKIYEKYLKVPSSSLQKKPSVIGIRGHFIKLESINQNQKPVYKEFSLWPAINLNFEAGGCPFSPPRVSARKRPTPSDTGKQSLRGNEARSVSRSTKYTFETPRMTRKVRSRLQRGHDNTVAVNNSPVISGYCEICQLTYLDQKRHIKCDRHVQFVRNSNNFISLDQLIKQGPTMDTFLKLNGANQISPCTGELSGSTRRSLRRLHSFAFGSSASWKTNEQVSFTSKRPSPVSSSNGHHITRSSTGVRQALEEKNTMLLQQKESLEVQCNGMWSHCYGTRHAGLKSPISGNIARRVQWEMQGEGSCRPQRMRRASASFYGTASPSLQQQLSPTGSDSGHHLRSRGQLWLPSNLLGTTAEDEARARLGHISADPQPARTYRDIPPAFTEDEKPKVVIKEEVKSLVNRSGNSQAIKRKRLSVEEKLIEDNKAYYKLELKNSKLRSSGYFLSHRHIEIPIKTEVKEEKVDSTVVKCNGEQGHEGTKKESKAEEGGAGIKFQRVRKSELTLLSDEAESFMFGEPVRQDSSTESSEEDEEKEEEVKKKVTKNLKKENTKEEVSRKPLSDNKRTFKKKDDEGSLREQPSSVPPVIHLKIGGEDACQGNALHCDESSVDTCSVASSCDTNSATRQKRKRRTHAEAFIHDNLDYYKFEIPGSRLRFQGSILPPTLTPVESKPLPTSNDTKDCSGGKHVTGTPSGSRSPKGAKATCNGAHSKIVTCSNEATNEKENIVHTQEDSKEKVVEQNENKKLEKQEKEDDRKEEERDETPVKETVEDELLLGMEKLHFSFEVVPQSEPWYRTYTRQDEGEEFYAYSSMSDSCYWKPFLLPYELPLSEVPGSSNSGPGPSGVVKRRRNRFAHMLDKKPRKSPRCHASTLAILSSLRHYRRRKEPDKPKDETPKTEVMNISSEEDNTNVDILDTSRDDSKDVPEDTCMNKDPLATSKDAPGATVNNTIKNTPGTDKDVVSKNVPDVTKDSPAVSKDVDAVKEVAGTSEDASSLSTGAGSSTETTIVVVNSDFKSESDPDIHEIARNIDKMFGLGTDGEDLSASENDASSDETNVSHKNRKSVGGKKNVKNHSRKSTSAKGKKGKVGSSKRRDVLEIDPLVLQEFAVELTTKSTVENQCRGGPMMDVVTLLEEFSQCRCMEDSAPNAPNTSLLLGESSCNSSECGASSTCETVNFSDGPEGRILQIRGRKRKRKKNLTGWPAEKQRGKKKVVGKVSRTDENVPTGVDASKKCAHNSDKLCLSVEGSEVSRGSVGTVKEVTNKTERPSKSGEKSKAENKTECSSKVGVCREDTNSGVGKVKHSSGGNCELSVAPEKRASVARTESLDSSGSEYQPCVRVTKIPDLAGVMLPNSTSSYLVAGISNSRRLRSSSLSSSPPRISVPVQRKYASLSIDSWKRPVESSSSKRRASPRKSLSRSDAEWTPWCIVRKQR